MAIEPPWSMEETETQQEYAAFFLACVKRQIRTHDIRGVPVRWSQRGMTTDMVEAMSTGGVYVDAVSLASWTKLRVEDMAALAAPPVCSVCGTEHEPFMCPEVLS